MTDTCARRAIATEPNTLANILHGEIGSVSRAGDGIEDTCQSRINLGQMMAGGDRGGRQKDDYYATPPACTRALIDVEGARMPDVIWEPACGDGAISRLIEETGRVVRSSDLVDRGCGEAGIDFLLEKSTGDSATKGIVTNPPFKLAPSFIRHALSLGVPYVVMFLKATFWHAASRSPLFYDHRPARIYAMNWRPDFDGRGQPTMDCLWCVWDGIADRTEYEILIKPKS